MSQSLDHAVLVILLGAIGAAKCAAWSIGAFICAELLQAITGKIIPEWPDEVKKTVAALLNLGATVGANLGIPTTVLGPFFLWVGPLLTSGLMTVGSMFWHDLASWLSKAGGNHPAQNPQGQLLRHRWRIVTVQDPTAPAVPPAAAA